MVKKPKSSRGYQARGSKGGTREKLARASGFRSDAEITELFPANMHKSVRQLQQVLAELVKAQSTHDLSGSPIAIHYAGLVRSLANPQACAAPTLDPTPGANTPSEHRARKQSALAADALRQVVLEAVETPLAMLPSLLADESLSDQEKLKRLRVYADSLEMLYEPLQLEAIGEPGDSATFDPRLHESAKNIPPGDSCTIKRIGFTRGGSVIRKAVVDIKE